MWPCSGKRRFVHLATSHQRLPTPTSLYNLQCTCSCTHYAVVCGRQSRLLRTGIWPAVRVLTLLAKALKAETFISTKIFQTGDWRIEPCFLSPASSLGRGISPRLPIILWHPCGLVKWLYTRSSFLQTSFRRDYVWKQTGNIGGNRSKYPPHNSLCG